MNSQVNKEEEVVVQEGSYTILTSSPTSFNRPVSEADWKTFDDANFSIDYPSNWIASSERDGYLGDELTVTNETGSVVVRVTSEQQPYSFPGYDKSNFKEENVNVLIQGKNYQVKVTTVDNRKAYADFAIDSGKRVMFGTGYPVGDDNNISLSNYQSNLSVIQKVLSTLKIKS